jgi:uncharacterized protein HemY
VTLARQAIERDPERTAAWSVLGVAHGQAGDWDAARTALDKAIALPGGGDATDLFWLALAHAQFGQTELARKSYETAVRWMEANRPGDRELSRLRAEAENRLRELDASSRSPAPPEPDEGRER